MLFQNRILRNGKSYVDRENGKCLPSDESTRLKQTRDWSIIIVAVVEVVLGLLVSVEAIVVGIRPIRATRRRAVIVRSTYDVAFFEPKGIARAEEVLVDLNA